MHVCICIIYILLILVLAFNEKMQIVSCYFKCYVLIEFILGLCCGRRFKVKVSLSFRSLVVDRLFLIPMFLDPALIEPQRT